MCTRTLSTTISTSPLRSLGSSLAMAGLSHAEPVGRAKRARRTTRGGLADDQPDDDPGEESADMGEQCDAPARARGAEGHDAGEDLDREPEAEQDDGRHLDQLEEQPEVDERQDACPREEDEVRA